MTAPHPQYPQGPHPSAPWAAQQGPYRPAPSPWAPQGPPPQGPYGWQPQPRRGLPAWVIAGLLVLAVLAVGAVAAVGSGGTSRSGASGTQPAGSVTAQPGGTDCPGGSLEGCYTEGQMDRFLGQAIWFVQGFSDQSYRDLPHPKAYSLIAEGRSAHSPCGNLDATTYAYCPGDDRIYIGQKQLWALYSGIGDAAAVVGLAHEYGHHIQQAAGVPAGSGASASVVHENQADCIAGAFVGWARDRGYLEDSDAQDIEGLVRAIASSEDDPGRDHGDLQERARSLSTGIEQGLRGCDAFYPGTPVSPAA